VQVNCSICKAEVFSGAKRASRKVDIYIGYPMIAFAGSCNCRFFDLLRKRTGSRKDGIGGIGCNGAPLQAIPRAHHAAETVSTVEVQDAAGITSSH